MTRIWNEEMSSQGVKLLALDPGDMDTPMHALAVPDADRRDAETTERCGSRAADAIADLLPAGRPIVVRRAS